MRPLAVASKAVAIGVAGIFIAGCRGAWKFLCANNMPGHYSCGRGPGGILHAAFIAAYSILALSCVYVAIFVARYRRVAGIGAALSWQALANNYLRMLMAWRGILAALAICRQAASRVIVAGGRRSPKLFYINGNYL